MILYMTLSSQLLKGGVALIIQAAWIIRDLTLGDPTDSILDLTLARGPGLAPQLGR